MSEIATNLVDDEVEKTSGTWKLSRKQKPMAAKKQQTTDIIYIINTLEILKI